MSTEKKPLENLYLSTGDPNFADLFGGRSECDGIFIPRGKTGLDKNEECTTGASVVITGPPGSGKTLLACQISATSIHVNDKIKQANPEMPSGYWPSDSLIIYYTSDQTADEITSLCKSFAWGVELKYAILKNFDTSISYGDVDIAPAGVNMILIEMPHDTSVDNLWKHIQVYVSRVMNGRPAIIVVDAINSLMKAKDGYYTNFRDLVKFPHSSGLPHVNLILVLEEDRATPMMEEYVPQCVIRLGRGRGLAPSRTIEISKARHQAPLIGEHEFSVVAVHGLDCLPSHA